MMRAIIGLVGGAVLLLVVSRLFGITTNITELDRWVALLLHSIGLGGIA